MIILNKKYKKFQIIIVNIHMINNKNISFF